MLDRIFKRKSIQPEADGFIHGNTHLIELRNLVKSYKTGAGVFTALRGVSLNVDSHEFLAIVGKSGSGKSTLINMITGIDRPTTGEVLVGDTAVHRLNEGQMAVWRGKHVGVIFQFFQLLPTLTVLENVMLPMDFCNMYTARERPERAMQLLEMVDMAENAHKLPSACSGGQQQRAAIARSLANDPQIIVADEPTGNLDSKTANAIASAAKATGSAWTLPPETISPESASTSGLSVTALASISSTRAAWRRLSRQAPTTCGWQRRQ